jgi:hypothetical protein
MAEKKTEKKKGKYDTEKDVTLKELGPIEGTNMHMVIRAYDGGDPKLSVYRIVGKNNDKVRQVFRLPLGEVDAILAAISGLAEDLEAYRVEESGE